MPAFHQTSRSRASLSLALGFNIASVSVVLSLVVSGAAVADNRRAPSDGDSAGRSSRAALAALGSTRMCIDQQIADRLAVKRKRRGAVDRLFIKQARHEFSLLGGYYLSDLYSGTYVVSGSYTYHMTEDTSVEFSAGFTHENADVIVALEDGRASILDDDFARTLFFESALVWAPIYGKLRLGGNVMHFDIHLDLGVGVVDSQTSRGAAGVAGAGFKLFLGKAWAFRVDVRDHIFRQELLDKRFLVNDVSITSGFSLFLPLGN